MKLRFSAAAHTIARPGGLPWSNQDAHFCGRGVYGVFDGVSTAARSREYAAKLAATCAGALGRGAEDEPWPGCAADALKRAQREASAIDGASTACLLKIDTERGIACGFNLGDSGFLLFETDAAADGDGGRARLRASSAARVHGDGAPYQLGGGSCISDAVSSGVPSSHPIGAGTVALLHTDALTDNLDDDEICEIVGSAARRPAAEIAKSAASAAHRKGASRDDVTVICVKVMLLVSGAARGGRGARRSVGSSAPPPRMAAAPDLPDPRDRPNWRRRFVKLLPFAQARETVRSIGFGTKEEWDEWVAEGKSMPWLGPYMPSRPDLMYEEEWEGWDDWLGTMLPFDEARRLAHTVCRTLGVDSQESWWALVAERPGFVASSRLPARPHIVYAASWRGYDDWLGRNETTLFAPRSKP